MSFPSLSLFPLPINEINKELKGVIKYFEDFEFMHILQIVIYFFIGLLITIVARWFVGKITEKHISAHHSMLFRRFTFYIGLTLSFIYPLKASGVDVTALLGAAGLLTAGVVFAAQTSTSNFISGVFLVAEKPFEIGDYITVSDMLGEVLSIDLLSVKIRTKDNTLVRIPNETLLKAQFRNVSRFPIRRVDVKLRFNFNEDLVRVNKILLETAAKNPLCLVTPMPELSFLHFGDAGIEVQFSVWGKQSTFNNLQTDIQMDIQAAITNAKIEIPVAPHAG